MQDALIDERALSKLRWRCRRGLLENDLFIERFFVACQARVTQGQARGLLRLMDLSDNDLLDLLLARSEPDGELSDNEDAVQVLRMLRTPAVTREVSTIRDARDRTDPRQKTSGVPNSGT